MKANEKRAVWFLCTTLLCVFTLTMLLLIQGVNQIYYAVTGLLLPLQAAGLLLALTGETKPDGSLLRLGNRLNFLLSFFAIAIAAASFLMMSAQFHRTIRPDAEGNIAALDMEAVEASSNSYVYRTDDNLYIIFPEYSRVEYVFEVQPSMADPEITFFCSSAFYERNELGFRHDNVTGDHVHLGQYYQGADVAGLGAFTFMDGKGYFDPEDPKKALRRASENGGEGFEQYIPICNGQLLPCKLQKLRCYRVLADLNGRLCIVESAVPLRFEDFIRRVLDLGVMNAAYLDMGAKSSFSRYRNGEGEAVDLFGVPMPVVHSWLVFRK